MKQKHPYEHFINYDTEKLIIGTCPPPRFKKNDRSELLSNDLDFYYGSCDNRFWDIIIKSKKRVKFQRGTHENEIKERKNFLKENKIGLCDIYSEIVRKKPNSALDSNINKKESIFIDIMDILLKYPSIKELYYTSNEVKSCINESIKKYSGIKIVHRLKNKENKEYKIKLNGKSYNIFILPSPSKRSPVDGETKIKMYEKLFN